MTVAFKVPAPGEAAEPVRTPAELQRIAGQQHGKAAVKRRKEAAKRRWMLLNAFVDNSMAALESSDVAVWVAMFRHARADGVAVVARSFLVGITGLATNTITASLRRLAAVGCVVRLRRGGPVGGAAVYRLQIPSQVGQ